MVARWFVLLTLLVVASKAAQDLYVSGSFITSLVQEDGTVKHASGIVAYDPDSDEFIDKFTGGVYINVGTITILKETLFGIIGAGHFRYVDDGFGYSSAVLYYDGDNDDYQGLNDGIWLENGDSVRYIASIDNYVVFAGTFSTVESLSIEKFVDDEADVVVPNIVKMNSNKEYSLLQDPDKVFPADDSIQGLVASDNGNTLFVYTAVHGIYSWDPDNYYQLIVPVANLTHNTLTIDSNNNLYAVSKINNGASGGSNLIYDYYLAVFNASQDYTGTYINFLSINTNICGSSTVLLTAWNDGILISYPDVSTGCESTVFQYYDPENGTLSSTYIPSGPYDISSIVNGKDNDLWVIPYSNFQSAEAEFDYIYYFADGAAAWAAVNLSPVKKFTAYGMTWDSDKDELLLFVNDLTTTFTQKLIKVNTDFYPPSGSTELDPGTIGNYGAVHGVASIQDEDDEDYEIYIGGIFNYVGDGVSAQNLVKFSKGDWQAINSPPVKTLYAYDSTLYIAYLNPAQNGEALPVHVINTQGTSTDDIFTSLPTVIGGSGTVTALYSDDEEIFVGGDFTVQLPGSGATANGVVVYSKLGKNWYSIGIPNTIKSSVSDGYNINSFSVNVVNGSSILAIGGLFNFAVNSYNYSSLALYNLDSDTWIPVPLTFGSGSYVQEVLLNNTGVAYLGGELDINFQPNINGVASYSINSSSISEVGNLEDIVDGIAIYTDDKNREYLYAAGFLNKLPNVNGTYGLAYTELSSGNQTWVPAGTDTILYNLFTGTISNLIYQTGGQGVNGTNGNDSSYSSGGGGGGGGGGNGWWITLIVLGVLFVVIAVPVGGFAAYKFVGKRKNYYEEL